MQISQNTVAWITEEKNLKKDCTEFGIAPAHLEDKMISAINFSRDRLNILLLKQTLMALKTYTCVKNQANQTALQYQSQAFIHSHKKFHVNWNNVLRNQHSAVTNDKKILNTFASGLLLSSRDPSSSGPRENSASVIVKKNAYLKKDNIPSLKINCILAVKHYDTILFGKLRH